MPAVIKSVPVTVLQITESLKRYGINEGVTSMLVARFDGKPEEVRHVQGLKEHLSIAQWLLPSSGQGTSLTSWPCLQMANVQEVVKGEVTPLASLGDLTDAQAIQKVRLAGVVYFLRYYDRDSVLVTALGALKQTLCTTLPSADAQGDCRGAAHRQPDRCSRLPHGSTGCWLNRVPC